MIWLLGTTLFLSAFLVFAVQPWAGRMVLPLLGGGPSVWNTCMLFFQVALLGAYAYAHAGLVRCKPGPQRWGHLLLLGLACVTLPPAVAAWRVDRLAEGALPVPWLLMTLAAAVGLPFMALAATAPTLLRWCSRTGHPSARDPHFLYAASNLGSLSALLCYPLLIEPYLSLPEQARWWSAGVVLVTLLMAMCGWATQPARWPSVAPHAWASQDRRDAMDVEAPVGSEVAAEVAPGRLKGAGLGLRWVGLAAVPASLVLGVTHYITTDLASVPFFWVVPLAVYLLTFILAFSRWPALPVSLWSRVLPVVAGTVAFALLTRAVKPIGLVVVLHLLLLFVGGMLCHTRLAALRPQGARITAYYLAMALGGVLGGVFNSLMAPWLFVWVAEYPVALVVVCLLRPWSQTGSQDPTRLRWLLDVGLALLLGVFAAGAMLAARVVAGESVVVRNALGVGLPIVVGFVLMDRPLRHGLGLAAVLLAGWGFARSPGHLVYAERTFFGVTRVATSPNGELRWLIHGNTLHGCQSLDPARAGEPLAYYHPTGPAGDVFAWAAARSGDGRIGVVGLGAGALAAYATPGQDWTFFEIDPAVIRVAQNTNWFTYLARCRARQWGVIQGDARLQLAREADGSFALLVIDAFSSDAIPVHLLTRQALALYRSKLQPDGLLAFHISNRYLELAPVVADLADDAGLVCRSWDDWDVSPAEVRAGKEASEWLVLVAQDSDLGVLERLTRWLPISPREPPEVWSDDFANLLGALKWGSDSGKD